MPTLVWNAWAPPKCKLFAWMIIQNRVWTADRLQRRGWPNCGNCPLCGQVQESGVHLLFHCRFSARIWNAIATWIGTPLLLSCRWEHLHSVLDCWTATVTHPGAPRKAVASMIILTSWKLWNERNSRIFRHSSHLPSLVISEIKEEARTWCTAGAKCLVNFIPGE